MNRRRFARSSLRLACGMAVVAVGAVVAALSTDRTGCKGSGLGPAFELNVCSIRHVEPSLVRYVQVKSIPVEVAGCRALALDSDDRIFVLGADDVAVLDRDGRRQAVFRLSRPGRCLAVAEDGMIYVGSKATVDVYSPAGLMERSWEIPGPTPHLTAIAVGTADVFVADFGGKVVLRYDRQGILMNRIGQRDSDRNIPGLVAPSPYMDLAIAPDGQLRVANPGRQRVEAYTFDGDLEFHWGRPSAQIDGFIGCCNPAHLAILPDGAIVTSEKGDVPTVKVFRPDRAVEARGVLNCVVAGPRDLGSGAADWDVAADSSGRVLVLDSAGGRVRVFAPREAATQGADQ